jgi:hypothetical protein
MKTNRLKPKALGFTTIELLIASSISLVVTGMILSTYIQSLRGLNHSHQRMNLAQEMNTWTSQLVFKASRSNQFVLYKSSASGAIHQDLRQGLIPGTTGGILCPGGDLAVFVFFQFPKDTDSPLHLVRRVEAYSLTDKDASGIGAVEHITIEFDEDSYSDSHVEDILTNSDYYVAATGKWTSGTFGGVRVTVRKPFPMIRGLAIPENEDRTAILPANATPRLFYMSADRNIVVMGQHYSGNKNRNSNDRRTHTNAFSFNITPRT